jgi:glycine/D-amino acid oxidase-like deaminating enzyme/nitrite reductase/ring-hydroxylating ferredoxin subunit
MSKSVWQQRVGPRRASFPSLRGRRHRVDTCVVGGGITGLTCAAHLKRAGQRVAVVEAFSLGDGTTGRSTGHLTTVIDSRYAALVKTLGREGAAMVHQSMAEGIDVVEHNVKSLNIACDFERLDGVLYCEPGQDTKELHAEFAAMQQAQVLGATMVSGEATGLPFRVDSAIQCPQQGQFNPAAYCKALGAFIHDGDRGTVFEASRVGSFDESDTSVVHLDGGGEIECRSIVLATHTPIGLHASLQTRLKPQRSYVVAVRVPKALVPSRLYWDMDDPYHYIRNYSSKEPNVMVIGGCDHKTGEPTREGGEAGHAAALRDYVTKRFPQHEVLAEWSAQFYDPVDGLPFIGLLPLHKHVYVGTGYLGEGLVFGSLAGPMIADAILGKPSRYADLFSPSRLNRSGTSHFIKENVKVGAHLVGDLFHYDTTDVASVRPGQGCLVQHGLHKMAAYRDSSGVLHSCSATCPHMKCVVKWNNAERSWDCPCHGSRFAVDGAVIEGPTLSALERV